jgi:hypothetical protein
LSASARCRAPSAPIVPADCISAVRRARSGCTTKAERLQRRVGLECDTEGFELHRCWLSFNFQPSHMVRLKARRCFAPLRVDEPRVFPRLAIGSDEGKTVTRASNRKATGLWRWGVRGGLVWGHVCVLLGVARRRLDVVRRRILLRRLLASKGLFPCNSRIGLSHLRAGLTSDRLGRRIPRRSPRSARDRPRAPRRGASPRRAAAAPFTRETRMTGLS